MFSKNLKKSFPSNKIKMAADTNFESMSYNPFTVNDNFFNSGSDPDFNFYCDISPLD